MFAVEKCRKLNPGSLTTSDPLVLWNSGFLESMPVLALGGLLLGMCINYNGKCEEGIFHENYKKLSLGAKISRVALLFLPPLVPGVILLARTENTYVLGVCEVKDLQGRGECSYYQ
jgi:hypothetical protein